MPTYVVNKSVIAQERVPEGEVAAFLANGTRLRRKRKADERERNEKERRLPKRKVNAIFGYWCRFINESYEITPGLARQKTAIRAGNRTLGQLLREIHATGNAPQDLTEALDRFVPKRNWLVHHSRHETHKQMYSAAGRASLVAKNRRDSG